MTKVENISLYYLKAFAIISVALAHSCYTQLPHIDMGLFLERLSRVGVFIFFFLAGYFFKPQKNFWKKKFTRLFIPWLLAAVWMYSYPKILHHQVWFLKGCINYFIGNGSYLYFLTILCACYILCWYYNKFHKLLFVYIALNIISILLTAAGVFPQEVYAERWFFSYFNPYLNIFNWIGIFAFGIFMQSSNRLSRVQTKFYKYRYVAFPLAIILIIMANIFDISAAYWSYFALPLELLITFVLLGLSAGLTQKKFLLFIGKNTLPIYLYHLMIIGNLCFFPNYFLVAILRPVVCVLICAVLFYIGQNICGKISLKFKNIFNILLGLS